MASRISRGAQMADRCQVQMGADDIVDIERSFDD